MCKEGIIYRMHEEGRIYKEGKMHEEGIIY